MHPLSRVAPQLLPNSAHCRRTPWHGSGAPTDSCHRQRLSRAAPQHPGGKKPTRQPARIVDGLVCTNAPHREMKKRAACFLLKTRYLPRNAGFRATNANEWLRANTATRTVPARTPRVCPARGTSYGLAMAAVQNLQPFTFSGHVPCGVKTTDICARRLEGAQDFLGSRPEIVFKATSAMRRFPDNPAPVRLWHQE